MLNNKYIKINRKYIYETRLVLIHFTDCKLKTLTFIVATEAEGTE